MKASSSSPALSALDVYSARYPRDFVPARAEGHGFLGLIGRTKLAQALAAKVLFPTPDGPEWETRRVQLVEELAGQRVQARTPCGALLDGMFFRTPEGKKTIVFVPGMDGYYEDNFSNYLVRLFKERLVGVNVLIFNYPSVMASEGELSADSMALTAYTGCMWLVERAGFSPNDIVVYGQSLGGAAAVRGVRWVQSEFADARMKLISERSFVCFPEVIEEYCGKGALGKSLKALTAGNGWSTPELLEAFDAIQGEKLVVYSPWDGVVLRVHSLAERLLERNAGLENVTVVALEGPGDDSEVSSEEHWRQFTPTEETMLIGQISRMLGPAAQEKK